MSIFICKRKLKSLKCLTLNVYHTVESKFYYLQIINLQYYFSDDYFPLLEFFFQLRDFKIIYTQRADTRHYPFLNYVFDYFFFTTGLVNEFLSWKAFIPLSRLTYATYLWHNIVMYLLFDSFRSSIVVTDQIFVSLEFSFSCTCTWFIGVKGYRKL